MSKHAVDPGLAQAHLELRRARISDLLSRPISRPDSSGEKLGPDRLQHLRREAEELYWNELAWEELTDEEAVTGGHLTELAFPAFLSFVDGLLLERTVDTPSAASARPEVVDEILRFLSERYLAFTAQLRDGADSERIVWARAMTARLIDLVLYRLYQLTPEEREEIDGVG